LFFRRPYPSGPWLPSPHLAWEPPGSRPALIMNIHEPVFARVVFPRHFASLDLHKKAYGMPLQGRQVDLFNENTKTIGNAFRRSIMYLIYINQAFVNKIKR
jgi:hypothetical protein